MATALELAGRESGGLVAEDVIRELFMTSKVERPLIDSIGSTGADNFKKEFTDKVLAASSSTNTWYENQDLSAVVDNNYGLRYYNFCQQMGKSIKMSERGRDVRTTYDEDEFLRQLADAMDELMRDEEAAAVSRNAATAEVAGTSGALMAGAATWAIHGTQRGTGAADAVLDGSTNVGGGPTTAPTAGNKRAMTETMLRTAIRNGWDEGAEFDCLISNGDMIETIANYMFTSTARVASMETSVGQDNRRTAQDGGGSRSGGVAAQGAVNMFIGNFGALTLMPDRHVETYTAADTGDVVDVLLVDSRYPRMAYLSNYQSKPISNNGLYDHTAVFVDCCFVPAATHAVTVIADITPTDPMTA